MRKLVKNTEAFTALESAIVLTAFLVVAAVFAYVVLGAGFFSIGKTKEVVHTGVDEATSSIELAGEVVARANSGLTKVQNITIPLQLAAGRNPVDLNATAVVISYQDMDSRASDIYINSTPSWPVAVGIQAAQNMSELFDGYPVNITSGSTVTLSNGTVSGGWDGTAINNATSQIFWVINDDDIRAGATNDEMLETGEKALITVNVSSYNLQKNQEFTLEIKPAQGGTLPITRTTPPSLDPVMILV